MSRTAAIDVDNRGANHMYEYLEARVDALKRRVVELEADNQALRQRNSKATHAPMMSEYAGQINGAELACA